MYIIHLCCADVTYSRNGNSNLELNELMCFRTVKRIFEVIPPFGDNLTKQGILFPLT